jgi:hypothetical protein
MKTNMVIVLACGILGMQRLNAQATYTAIDIRPSIANALGVDVTDIELFASGINGNGVIYGYATRGNQSHGFVWGAGGTVSIYHAPPVIQGTIGDLVAPSFAKVVGVSLAGEVALSTSEGSFIQHPSSMVSVIGSQANPLSLLWMNDNGSAAVFDSDDQTYGVWRNGVVNQSHQMFESGREYYPLSLGSDDELYGLSIDVMGTITSYRSFDGETETDLFGANAHQAIGSSSGVVIGVGHATPDGYPTTYVMPSQDVQIYSDTVPRIMALRKDDSGVHELNQGSSYAIPFGISPNGQLIAGVTFDDIAGYRDSGQGRATLWNGVNQVDMQIVSSGIIARDAIGVTDNAIALAKATGVDGGRTAAILVPMNRPLEVPQLPISSDDRLAMIVNGQAEAVDMAALAGKKVVVLVHGWAPGYGGAVESDPNLKAWNANAQWYFDMAERYAGDDTVVLGYSWVEGSATDSITQASLSRSNTDVYGEVLYQSLHGIASVSDSIEFVAHSHGSRVSVFGAYRLEETGNNVTSITMLDSPESPLSLIGGASSTFGGENSLSSLLEAYALRFGIGDGGNDTLVSNVYSSFGEAYAVDGVTNVKLVAYEGVSEGHSYPIEWLAGGGIIPNDSRSYVQVASVPGEELRLATIGDALSLGVSPLAVFSLKDGAQWTYMTRDGENSLAIGLDASDPEWSGLICLDGDTFRSVDIEYSLSDSAEDSLLSFWIDDTNVTSVIANGASDEEWRSVSIPVRGIEGLRRLGASLSGSGTATIRHVEVSHEMASTPEPSRALFTLVGLILVLWQRRRNGAALPLKNLSWHPLHLADVF